MRYARLQVGTQSVLATIEDGMATTLMVDPLSPGVDPLRTWLSDPTHAGPSTVVAVNEATLLAPVTGPQKIIAVGFNYRAHGEELAAEPPPAPLLFNKAPSAIIGNDDVIVAPPHLSPEVDYEGELAVIIGTRAHQVSVDTALEHVLGYTICNDVSARDAQRDDGQFFRAKSFDTFCPLGPWIVTTDELPDPQALSIRTTVNGELRQNSPTSDMVFSVAEIISYASQYLTLVPGDVITTGSPAGVGAGLQPPKFLADGDEIVVEIDGIGTLRNIVSTTV